MRVFPTDLGMLNKLLGYQCIYRTLGPSMLVRSDGFHGTMAQLHSLGWSDWTGFDHAKIDEGNDQDDSYLLGYTLESPSREVDTLEIQAIAHASKPWPSLSDLFASAERMEGYVEAINFVPSGAH